LVGWLVGCLFVGVCLCSFMFFVCLYSTFLTENLITKTALCYCNHLILLCF
jgi:hypothetical protein